MEFLASLAIKALIGTSICGSVTVGIIYKCDRTLLGFEPSTTNTNKGTSGQVILARTGIENKDFQQVLNGVDDSKKPKVVIDVTHNQSEEENTQPIIKKTVVVVPESVEKISDAKIRSDNETKNKNSALTGELSVSEVQDVNSTGAVISQPKSGDDEGENNTSETLQQQALSTDETDAKTPAKPEGESKGTDVILSADAPIQSLTSELDNTPQLPAGQQPVLSTEGVTAGSNVQA